MHHSLLNDRAYTSLHGTYIYMECKPLTTETEPTNLQKQTHIWSTGCCPLFAGC